MPVRMGSLCGVSDTQAHFRELNRSPPQFLWLSWICCILRMTREKLCNVFFFPLLFHLDLLFHIWGILGLPVMLVCNWNWVILWTPTNPTVSKVLELQPDFLDSMYLIVSSKVLSSSNMTNFKLLDSLLQEILSWWTIRNLKVWVFKHVFLEYLKQWWIRDGNML